IINAIQHGEADTLEVRSEITTTEIIIRVRNDGKPIPPIIRDKILSKGYIKQSGGRGFGLAIAKKIIEAHGWTIVLENTENTSFRIGIPTI
ncbi:MAG: sensor histidine kinase, partial [Candidatus Thorarchaeota archaeon]